MRASATKNKRHSLCHSTLANLVVGLGGVDEASGWERLAAFSPGDTAMPDLPARFAAIIITFAPFFTRRSWLHVQVLLVGAILAPGRRTVASVLRIRGHARDQHFTNYHRVLSRAPWNARDGARTLLGHLVQDFAPRGPIIVGLDDTIERCWGSRIAARGIYRDLVRSSHSHFVKTGGLRWISLMLLAPIPWAGRV